MDDLLDALPPSLTDSGSGIAFGHQGEVTLGDGFRAIEAAWMTGVAAMAQATRRIRVGCQVTGMIYRHPAVLEEDLPGIYAHIARDNPAAAERVLDAVEATLDQLARQPLSGIIFRTRNRL